MQPPCVLIDKMLRRSVLHHSVRPPSVMDAAFLRDRALSEGEEESRGSTPRTADGAEGEVEERASLARVEALADNFCEQVRCAVELDYSLSLLDTSKNVGCGARNRLSLLQ